MHMEGISHEAMSCLGLSSCPSDTAGHSKICLDSMSLSHRQNAMRAVCPAFSGDALKACRECED